MANYHKRNSIRAVQWDPENTQSFEDIKKLVAENPGLGWKADNIVRTRLCAGWRPRRYLHHQHKAGIAGKAQAEGSR